MSEIVNLPEPDQFGFCLECGHRDECLDSSQGAYFSPLEMVCRCGPVRKRQAIIG